MSVEPGTIAAVLYLKQRLHASDSGEAPSATQAITYALLWNSMPRTHHAMVAAQITCMTSRESALKAQSNASEVGIMVKAHKSPQSPAMCLKPLSAVVKQSLLPTPDPYQLGFGRIFAVFRNRALIPVPLRCCIVGLVDIQCRNN